MVTLNPKLAESRSGQLKQGLMIREGAHFKSIVVQAHCDRIVEIPAFHHLYYLVVFMVTTTDSGICFSD